MAGYDLQVARILSVYHTATYSWELPEPVARPRSGLVYFEQGSITYHFSDGDYTAEPGDVLVFPKGLRYSGEKQTAKNRFIVVDFEEEPDGGLALLNLPRVMNMGENGGRMFRQIADTWNEGRMQSVMRTRSLLYAILAELVEINAHGNRRSELLEAVLVYLSEHYMSPDMDVEAVGREFHISTSQLRRIFQQSIGTSPGQYIMNLRLELAQNLLRHECLSVREVAAKSGFSSEFYFSRLFKKKFGVPPSVFKG